MSEIIKPLLRALRILILCVVMLSLISPQTVSGKNSSLQSSNPKQSSGLTETQDLYLPIVVKVTYYPGSKACLVTDTAGVDDHSFNAGAWKGIQDAVNLWHIQSALLESEEQSDYPTHLNTFINAGCDIITTVGYSMGGATLDAAAAHPAQKFSIVDFAYDPVVPNILAQVYVSNQAAFLAGYTAAGVTQTGKVGTFGGMQFPTVTAYMDGFALGVMHYNLQHSTAVEVLGWDPAAQTGEFIGSFTSLTAGHDMADSMIDDGADIIMPVAGPAGLGAAAAAEERGSAYIVGIDFDWYVTAPDYKEIILTSVVKNTDATTFLAIQSVLEGSFAGGVLTGNLENRGVGLAPFHDLAGLVSPELQAELETVKAGIIDGTIATTPG